MSTMPRALTGAATDKRLPSAERSPAASPPEVRWQDQTRKSVTDTVDAASRRGRRGRQSAAAVGGGRGVSGGSPARPSRRAVVETASRGRHIRARTAPGGPVSSTKPPAALGRRRPAGRRSTGRRPIN